MKQALREAFTLDLRSLAVCRMAAGLVILGDLITRASEFRLHYTELGILPREAVFDNNYHGFPAIHLWSGLWEWQVAVFLAHGCIALALLAGYRTRWTTILAWYFENSLMARDYLVNNGGDAVLVSLLFWAMFVPWGEFWSLDALARPPDRSGGESRGGEVASPPGEGGDTGTPAGAQSPPSSTGRSERIFSAATVCFAGQVLLMYWISVYHKMEPTWLSGQAVYYSFQSDLYSRPTRALLMPFPAVMAGLTYATLVWETVGPWLLICPWLRLRLAALAGFSLLHVGFGFFLRLGIFAVSPQLNFLALLPSQVWSRRPAWPPLLVARLRRCNELLRTPEPPPPLQLTLDWSAVLAALMFYSLLQGLGNTNRSDSNPLVVPQLRWVGSWTGLVQRWAVFINLPAMPDGCVLVQSQLADGSSVDLFQGRDPFTWDKPTEVSDTHGLYRWPTPLLQIVSRRPLQPWFVNALVRDWNDHHSPARQVVSARLFFLNEPSLAEYRDSPALPVALYVWKPTAP